MLTEKTRGSVLFSLKSRVVPLELSLSLPKMVLLEKFLEKGSDDYGYIQFIWKNCFDGLINLNVKILNVWK